MVIKFLLIFVVTCAYAQEYVILDPPNRFELKLPDGARHLSTRNVVTHWITMPIDHFDPLNTDTYEMRYMVNEQFFGGDGYPIFIMIGGEWTIAEGWLLVGNMYTMSEQHKGYQIYTEHRYYGDSVPYTDFTSENLRFLTVDQALADLAYLIMELKQQPRFANSEVIVYGLSYSANMAIWFKQKYPDLAIGAVASSGPILAKVNYFEYLEVVNEAFSSEGGDQCMSIMRQGIRDTVEAFETDAGRLEIQRIYRLCTPVNIENRLDLGYFAALITWSFSGATQNAFPGYIQSICNAFDGTFFGSTPMEKIAGFIWWFQGWQGSCVMLSYEAFLNSYRVPRSNARAWYYQTCTEYGYFQTAPTSGTVFDPLHWLDVAFYADVCQNAFDIRFDEEFVYNAAHRINLIYGGLDPDVNNTINIHGYLDPWRALGVYDRDLTETSPTILVPRASHCFELSSWRASDTIRMTNAQLRSRRLVSSWLSNSD